MRAGAGNDIDIVSHQAINWLIWATGRCREAFANARGSLRAVLECVSPLIVRNRPTRAVLKKLACVMSSLLRW